MTAELNTDIFLLGVSLAIGLLIGIERGWTSRKEEEGTRVAGLRTFGLIGLLGGGVGLLSRELGPLIFGLSFLGFAGILATAYIVSLKYRGSGHDVSITSVIAALLTLVLGALATLGYVALSGSAAVVAALLLGTKPVLHGWLKHLEEKELHAGFKLLIISVVLLSILPNKTFGPWDAFNPFEVWWLVVLVATISFAGYFAMKLAGPKHGSLLTGLFAGVVSSTALTYHFSHLMKQKKSFADLLSLGILLACGMMYLRSLLFVLILNPKLVTGLFMPFTILSLLLVLPVIVQWQGVTKNLPKSKEPVIQNPLELKAALLFGALITIVLLLTKALQEGFGDLGIYFLSLITGLVDVDAMVLPLARLSLTELDLNLATSAIILAASSNSFLKGILAYVIAGKSALKKVTIPLVLVAVVGVSIAVSGIVLG